MQKIRPGDVGYTRFTHYPESSRDYWVSLGWRTRWDWMRKSGSGDPFPENAIDDGSDTGTKETPWGKQDAEDMKFIWRRPASPSGSWGSSLDLSFCLFKQIRFSGEALISCDLTTREFFPLLNRQETLLRRLSFSELYEVHTGIYSGITKKRPANNTKLMK